MKKFLLGSALAILGTSAALATDMPAKAPTIYKATPAYSWTGLYGGFSGGYAWGENNVSDTTLGSTAGKPKPSGGFGGAQLGYNYQFSPHWMIGGEIDLSYGDINDSIVDGGSGNTIRNKFDSFGTARTRFGYVQDRWLAYGTFGAIWLREKLAIASAGGLNTDLAQYHVGWVFGAGVEYAVDDRWSWKVEYLYAPFDRTIDNVGGQIRTTDVSLNIIRAGVNYRFGDGGASASYLPSKAAAPRSGWSGSYLGVHGGYAWNDLTDIRSGSGAGTAATKPDGGYGGFQGGYNWLFSPNMLLGFEIDSSFGSLKDSAQFSNVSVVGTAKIDDLGTARLRLGYLLTPETLVYATGGAAYAREKFSSTVLSAKFDHLGWTVGGGVEYMFAPQWSLKAEYLHADFSTYRDDTPIVLTSRTSDLKLDTVRVGINYYGSVIERLFGGR